MSPNDAADVAARCLKAPKDHYRQGYTLTGPSAIKDEEYAALLSKQLGATVAYEDVPLAEFCRGAEGTEWGPALDVAYLEQVKATGAEESLTFVTHAIEKICGRPGETVEQYLAGQAAFTPAEKACFAKPVGKVESGMELSA